MTDQDLNRLARMTPDEILKFKQAFFDENETLISAGNPKLSEPAREYYLSLCTAEQKAEAARVYAFHRQLDDVLKRALAIVQQRALKKFDAATEAFDAFIADFAPNVRAAAACAKMPANDTVATVLAGIVEARDKAGAPGAGSGSDSGSGASGAPPPGKHAPDPSPPTQDPAPGGSDLIKAPVGSEDAPGGSDASADGWTVKGGTEAGAEDRTDDEAEDPSDDPAGDDPASDDVRAGGEDGAEPEVPGRQDPPSDKTRQDLTGQDVGKPGATGEDAGGGQGASDQQKKYQDPAGGEPGVDYGAILRAAVDYLIPSESGYPVNSGWRFKAPAYFVTPYFIAAGKEKPRSLYAPMGVTWHWTAGSSMAGARAAMAKRQPGACKASAHYCIGKDASEGIERYVSLENGSWHAGKEQIMRWDGRSCVRQKGKSLVMIDHNWKGTRSLVGVEIVGLGEPLRRSDGRDPWTGVPEDQIIHAALPNGSMTRALAFNDEQYRMAIAVGREIVERWPHIRPWHHHGHLDICPDYKWDPLGFDFARMLRGVYQDEAIPDIWTPLRAVAQRQRVLNKLMELNRIEGSLKVDGLWGKSCRTAFRAFQLAMEAKKDKARPSAFGQWTATFFPPDVSTIEAAPRPLYTAVNGYWTTFTNWDVHAEFTAAGLSLEAIAGGPERDVADPARRVEDG